MRAAFFVPYRQPYRAVPGIRLELKCIMQTTASIQRTAQLRPLGIGKASIEAWLNAKSKVMTNLFGMEVTRLEGLRVYGAFGLMTVGAALSGVSLLVTALCVALAGYNVYKLNVEHPEGKGNHTVRDYPREDSHAQRGRGLYGKRLRGVPEALQVLPHNS